MVSLTQSVWLKSTNVRFNLNFISVSIKQFDIDSFGDFGDFVEDLHNKTKYWKTIHKGKPV